MSAKVGPYYSLYLNPLGRRRVGYYFPHDEVNDMGLREAIEELAQEAPPDAFVGGEDFAVAAEAAELYSEIDTVRRSLPA